MNRAGAPVLTIALALLCTATGSAEQLQRLAVQRFAMSADVARPEVEVPFHIVVTVHVREKVPQLANLVLPILGDLELQGDERAVVSDSGGTTYRENIAVIATHTGEIALAPATLDAIDARDGKAKRYFSNPLRLSVAGGALETVTPAESWLRAAASALALLFGAVVFITLLLVVVLIAIARGKPRASKPAQAEPVTLEVPMPARTPRDDLRDAATSLRAERTRAVALDVRKLVRQMVGANDVETLDDVLRRPASQDPTMRDLLRALERAAFTHDGDVPAAIDSALIALERAAP